MTPVGKSQARVLTSFWDTQVFQGPGKATPTYYLLNAGAHPMRLILETGKGNGERRGHDRTVEKLLPPGGRLVFSPLTLDPSLKTGILRISNEGDSGTLSVTGVMESDTFLTPLLTSEPASASEFLAVRVPTAEKGNAERRSQASLSFLNTASRSQWIRASILDHVTGRELKAFDRHISSGQIDSVDLSGLANAIGGSEFRLRVAGETSFLVQGWTELSGGTLAEIPLVPRESAHQNGTYPVPSLSEYDVFTTFVNVGSDVAQIALQVYWAGGTYAPKPITVPPGESRRLSIAELAAKAVPDLLGRTLDPAYEHGFLQWTAQRGSHEIIARTEVREHGDQDTFGYNCFACCPENSYAALIPSTIDFNIAEHPSFQAVEYVYTCNGTLGPYPAVITALTYQSPVSWNGSVISTSGYTSQTVGFSGAGDQTVYGVGYCDERPITIRANGPVIVDKCHAQNARDIDLTKSCAAQTATCASCQSCCEKVKKVGYCRCEELGFGLATCKAGIDIDKQRCLQACTANVCGE